MPVPALQLWGSNARCGLSGGRLCLLEAAQILVKDEIMPTNPMERPLAEVDPQIEEAIENEERRQHEGLELIASENFVSEAVLTAAGSVYTHK